MAWTVQMCAAVLCGTASFQKTGENPIPKSSRRINMTEETSETVLEIKINGGEMKFSFHIIFKDY